MTPSSLPSPGAVFAAADRLHGVAVRTPILRSDRLDALLGGAAFVKCESLQRTGAFKFRGAYNALSRQDPRLFPDGVIAYSTGNHGRAVAHVARELGMPATIVMPADAPSVKLARAREEGAEVVLYDRRRESREDIAASLSATRQARVLPPGDDPDVVAGQGTVALEGLDDLARHPPDLIVVPCGGGGLAAGTCLAVAARRSGAAVWAAEPAGFDDTRRSLLSGQRERNADGTASLCDALLAPTPAELPFSINRTGLAAALVATDAQVEQAMRFAFDEFHVVIEPGGAVGLAALMAQPGLLAGRRALIVASGGNVDQEVFANVLNNQLSGHPSQTS